MHVDALHRGLLVKSDWSEAKVLDRPATVDPGTVYGVQARALADGAEVVGPGHVRWLAHGRCESPVGVELVSRRPARMRAPTRNENFLAWVEASFRCRRCAPCLRARAWLWRQRALAEVSAAPRSFFGTLTIAPEWQYRSLAVAEADARDDGVEFSTLDPAQQFVRRVAVLNREFTTYLKRVRKQGLRIRYLLVAEHHKSGLPHFHVLVSEFERLGSDVWDTYCILKSQWRLGHSDFGGVDKGSPREASYICKYLSKSMFARVRASIDYGTASVASDDRGRFRNDRESILVQTTPSFLSTEAAKAAEGGASGASAATAGLPAVAPLEGGQ